MDARDLRAQRSQILRARRSGERTSTGQNGSSQNLRRANENINNHHNVGNSTFDEIGSRSTGRGRGSSVRVARSWHNGTENQSNRVSSCRMSQHNTAVETTHVLATRQPLMDITNRELPTEMHPDLTMTTPTEPRSCLTYIGSGSASNYRSFEVGESSKSQVHQSKRSRIAIASTTPISFNAQCPIDGTMEDPENSDQSDHDDNAPINDVPAIRQRRFFEKEDFGPPDSICPFGHCGAVVWKMERSLRSKNPRNPSYNICCQNGKVQLPFEHDPPNGLKELLQYTDQLSYYFRRNIREFNCRFSFTSTGGTIDNQINDGGGPYVFRLKGENHHCIGSLVPPDGQRPRFAQLYIYDTEHESDNRLRSFGSGIYTDIDVRIVHRLTNILDEHNQLVRKFRAARDYLRQIDVMPVTIRLLSSRSGDGRRYNLPTSSEVAALTVGLDEDEGTTRDIVIFSRSHGARRINILHPSIMSLHFPILFPFGSDGYRMDIAHRDGSQTAVRRRVTMREYYAFQLHHRHGVYSIIQRGGRLYQQYLVYAYCCILEDRFTYLRRNQDKFRCEVLYGLEDAISRGDTDASRSGRPCILPSSFTGGPRYMAQAFQDAMAICRWMGHPDLFITMTCNPKWNEIMKFMDLIPGQTPDDRPDVVARVFEMKLHSLLQDITKKGLFGKCTGVIATIEFQKRGLPHAHIAVFLQPSDKIRDASSIDRYVSAELPDRDTDPIAYDAVSRHMMHGPCGNANLRCACMSNGKCSKRYPRKLQLETTIGTDGYPTYRRRHTTHTVTKNGVKLDNTWVVPHNVDLVVKHDCHVCVEKTNRDMCVKYLCKYMHKGSDKSTVIIERTSNERNQSGQSHMRHVDELKQYMDCRYISASEACWRIFGYWIHKHDPPVERLSFHMPNEQSVVYDARADLEDVVQSHRDSMTKFLAWMEANLDDEEARLLTYVEFPSKYVWNQQDKKWSKRKRGRSVGRLRFVHPTAGERYYLRMLLNVVRGPITFADIRTVNGVVLPTYRETCLALGLLEGDGEWHEALIEASHWAMPASLRELFVTIMLMCQVAEPANLWMRNRGVLCDDILMNQRRIRDDHELLLTDEDIFNYGLYEIEKVMNRLGRSLHEFDGMPYPDFNNLVLEDNSLIMEELNYDRNALRTEHDLLYRGLNICQDRVYASIIDSIHDGRGGFYFVYGSGGTGKTYLWRTILARLRSEGKIVLAVASSGIAALLLPGGKTAHSRFKIPIEIDKDSFLNVKQSTPLADLIIRSSLIIWDEAPMAHRHAFEAVDRSLRDLMRVSIPGAQDRVFGGKTVVLGGDFRQILPVVPKGTRGDIVGATVCSSNLWAHCQIHVLTENMRLRDSTDENVVVFTDWLLNLGEGRLPLQKLSDEEEDDTWLRIPDKHMIPHNSSPMNSIIANTYPDLCNCMSDMEYLRERAILSARNEIVDLVNDRIMGFIPGENVRYLSADRISPTSDNVDGQVDLYPIEYLNTLKFSGLPNHELCLKVGVPIILMRNINHSQGLCNGTRLVVTKLGSRVLEAEVLSGGFAGRRCLIPRIEMVPSDSKLPFQFGRRQFPVKACFAMTINKSQGQTFNRVGLYLPEPVFSHGQLYVAASRVTSPGGFNVLIEYATVSHEGHTKNIVYTEIFDCLR